MAAEPSCPACGHPRAASDKFCAQCGISLQPTPAGVLPSNVSTAAPAERKWRAIQSPWLVGALVIATFNLYAMWWLGRTWWQIKQEDGDTGKRPVWHALAMLVPIYGYFRFYAHMRTIARMAATPEARATIGPGAMTVAWIVINVLSGTAGTRIEAPGWILLLASVLCGALIGWGQHGLNAVWTSLPGTTVRARMHLLHFALLAFGALMYLAAALLPTPTEA
jgi:hypothetical protein